MVKILQVLLIIEPGKWILFFRVMHGLNCVLRLVMKNEFDKTWYKLKEQTPSARRTVPNPIISVGSACKTLACTGNVCPAFYNRIFHTVFVTIADKYLLCNYDRFKRVVILLVFQIMLLRERAFPSKCKSDKKHFTFKIYQIVCCEYLNWLKINSINVFSSKYSFFFFSFCLKIHYSSSHFDFYATLNWHVKQKSERRFLWQEKVVGLVRG